jgi:hypothetical protein
VIILLPNYQIRIWVGGLSSEIPSIRSPVSLIAETKVEALQILVIHALSANNIKSGADPKRGSPFICRGKAADMQEGLRASKPSSPFVV